MSKELYVVIAEEPKSTYVLKLVTDDKTKANEKYLELSANGIYCQVTSTILNEDTNKVVI